jgi:hypothetical protein
MLLFLRPNHELPWLCFYSCILCERKQNVYHFHQIGFEFSPISLDPLAVVFNNFYNAAWELQTAALQLYEMRRGCSKASSGVYTDTCI